jgi:apolipoprotein N-acyltransferase
MRKQDSPLRPKNASTVQLHPLAKPVLALAMGAVAVAAWAPLAYWPLALLAYGTLFLQVGSHPQTLVAARLGLFFGLGLHLTGHSWVYTTMAGPAGMDSLSAALASTVVLLGLALFTALPCALHAKLMGGFAGRAMPAWLQATSFASLLTMGEMTRALVVDRLSSLSLGYALIDTWLAGWAPVLGAYGLSWIGYWMAAAMALTLATSRQMAASRTPCLFAAVAIALAGLLLQQVRWTEPLTIPLHFRLLQPNTTQGSKFDPALKARITQEMLDMLTSEQADLVVAPETAFPLYWNQLPAGVVTALQDFAHGGNSMCTMLLCPFGIATVGSHSEGHNSMVHMEPGETSTSRYDKIHLFPFGEYAPPGLAWITRSLEIPLQDLSGGAAAQPPFTLTKGQQTFGIGTVICNEIWLSDETRRWAPQANLLINPGNMAWFDGTLAIDHGGQITRMRALEVSRPILRVTNTGDTALILASGALAQALPLGQTASMTGTIHGQTGLTPFVRWGDWPVWVMCLLSIAGVLLARKTNRPRSPQSRETAPRYSQTG